MGGNFFISIFTTYKNIYIVLQPIKQYFIIVMGEGKWHRPANTPLNILGIYSI